MQQVEYPSIPGTEPRDYMTIIRSVLAYVVRESPSDKDLRRFMRSRSFFDKETAALLFDLLGVVVEKGKPTTLTDLGQKLYDIDVDNEWRKAFFLHLAGLNEILTKYVFDALDERLYSVNEMYRVLTSYVYPGETITLVNFKNWMAMIEATGMIKYIGIRWGPSPLLEEVREYLNGIDIEEILEEEEEDWDDDDEGAEDDLPALPSESAPATSSSAAPAAEEEEEEDFPDDFPPEPPAPPPQAAAAAQSLAAAGGQPMTPIQPHEIAPAVAPAAAAPMPQYKTALVLRSVAEIQEVQKVLELDPAGAEQVLESSSIDDAELAHNLNALQTLWGTTQDKRPLGFEHFQIAARDYGKKSRKKGIKTYFLYRALVAATCAFRPVRIGGVSTAPPRDGLDRFRVLEESGALSRHFQDDQSMDEVLTALVASGHGGRLDLLALTPYLILAKQALHGADDWVNKQEKAKKADQVWSAVYEQLHAGVFTLELIWLVRELARNDLWGAEGLKDTGVVPTQEVLDIAFDLGLVPSPYVGSFAATLWASRTLTGFTGDDLGYEASLLYFGREAHPADYAPRPYDYFSRRNLRR